MAKKIFTPLENPDYKLTENRNHKFLTGFIFLIIFLTIFIFLFFNFGKKGTRQIRANQGNEVEIISPQKRFSKTYQNPNGTYTTKIFASPINYQNEQGSWQEIDTSIEARSDESEFDFQNKKNSFETYFKKYSVGKFVKIKFNNSWIEYELKDDPGGLGKVNNVEGVISSNTIIYPNIYDGLDLKYIISREGLFKEFIIRDSIAAQRISEIKYEIQFDPDLTIEGKDTDGDRKIDEIKFNRDEGETLFLISKPAIYELNNLEERSDEFYYELIPQEGGKYHLSLKFKEKALEWLKDPQRIFPVVVDPTFNFPCDTSDGYIYGWDPSAYSWARSTSDGFGTPGASLSVGQYSSAAVGYYVYRSYLLFDTSAIPDGDSIFQVRLYMAVVGDYSGTDFDVRIHKYNWTSPISDANRESNYDGALSASLDQIWRNTSGIALDTYYASPSLDTSWVNKTGYTKYALVSSRDISGTTPTGTEEISILPGESTKSPYLEVTYGLPITVSGNAWEDEGTPLVWSGCDGATARISLRVGAITYGPVSCSPFGGGFIFNILPPSAGTPMVIWFDNVAGNYGSTINRYSGSGNVTGIAVMRNRVVIRNDDSGAVSNTDLKTFDNTDDTDINYDVDNSTPPILIVETGSKIVIESGKTFAPGGNVTTPAMRVAGTYSGGTEALTLNGIGTGSTCTAAAGTVRPLCIDGGTFSAPAYTNFNSSGNVPMG